MNHPALSTTGIFAVIFRKREGLSEPEILVNVRSDQFKQRKNANLPDTWSGRIVDLPGGTFLQSDRNWDSCLAREVEEETTCTVSWLDDRLVGPHCLFLDEGGTKERPHDAAYAVVCEIEGEPQPTGEATAHLWVTLSQLTAETEVRLPGKKGRCGRMARMIREAHGRYDELQSNGRAPTMEETQALCNATKHNLIGVAYCWTKEIETTAAEAMEALMAYGQRNSIALQQAGLILHGLHGQVCIGGGEAYRDLADIISRVDPRDPEPSGFQYGHAAQLIDLIVAGA